MRLASRLLSTVSASPSTSAELTVEIVKAKVPTTAPLNSGSFFSALTSISISSLRAIAEISRSPEWDVASDVMRDAREHLYAIDELRFLNSLSRSIEANMNRSGIHLIDEGAHYESLLLSARWYVAAMLVRSASDRPELSPVAIGLSVPLATALRRLPRLDLLAMQKAETVVRAVPFEHHAPRNVSMSAAAAVDGRIDLRQRIQARWAAHFVTARDGNIADSRNEAQWLESRRDGVTATDARKLVLLNGTVSKQRHGLLDSKLHPQPPMEFAPLAHGREREPIIAEWVEATFGIAHNSRLLHGQNPRHLATPDGLGEQSVSEIKTSTKPLSQALSVYRDQLQWQMHVTGVNQLLFVVENRYSLEREHVWVARDSGRILLLATHADKFLDDLDSARTRLLDRLPTIMNTSQEETSERRPTLIRPPSSARTLAPKAPVPQSAPPLPNTTQSEPVACPKPQQSQRSAVPPAVPSSRSYMWIWIVVWALVTLFAFISFFNSATNSPNQGNGYEVTCVDGSISYSGGIQGACSHHGGER